METRVRIKLKRALIILFSVIIMFTSTVPIMAEEYQLPFGNSAESSISVDNVSTPKNTEVLNQSGFSSDSSNAIQNATDKIGVESKDGIIKDNIVIPSLAQVSANSSGLLAGKPALMSTSVALVEPAAPAEQNAPTVPSTQTGEYGLLSAQEDDSPRAVETVLSTTGASITIKTSDKYFVYGNNTDRPFFAKLSGDYSGQYNAVLETTTPGGITCQTYVSGSNVYFSDISSILSTNVGPTVLKFSLKNYSGETVFGPADITVNYVHKDLAVVPEYYKYFRTNEDSLYTSLKIYGTYPQFNSDDIDLYLLDSNGNVVAKSLKNSNYKLYINYGKDYSDNAYSDVFPDNTLEANYTSINGSLLRAKALLPGSYSIKVVLNNNEQSSYVYNNVIQITDNIIVQNLYANSTGSIYPPPVYDSNEVCIQLRVDGPALKDDFKVVIKDQDNNTIGASYQSRYFNESTFLYKVKLDGSLTFNNTTKYSLEAVYLKDGNIVNTNEKNSLYPVDSFQIYYHTFNQGSSLADINLRAVNPDIAEGNIALRLLKDEIEISTASVAPAELINVQFKDTSGNIIKLENYKGYRIEYSYSHNYGNYSGSYRSSYYFYISESRNESGNNTNELLIFGNPYFYTDSVNYDFNVTMGLSANNITAETAFTAELRNTQGEIISTLENAQITKENTTVTTNNEYGEFSYEAVELSGKFNLPSGLSEGRYKLTIRFINPNQAQGSLNCGISGLQKGKVYASSSYPSIKATDNGYMIDGYAYMLKITDDQGNVIPYDSSKFSYVLTDLFGNNISVGPAEVTHYDYNYSYQDYYGICAQITQDIPEAYYNLKILYDGKEIYSIDNPSVNVLDEYSSLKNITSNLYLSYSYDENGNLVRIYLVNLKTTQTGNAKALLYEAESTEFKPVKEVTLQQDPEREDSFVFSQEELAGIDATKKYDVAVLYDGQYIGLIKNCKLVGSEIQQIAVSSVSLNKTELTLYVGGYESLQATIEPLNASNKAVTWSSSDTNVATVDENGKITAKAAGTAKITVTTVDGSKTGECIVTVKKNIATIGITKLSYNDGTEIPVSDKKYQVDGAKYPLAVSKPIIAVIKGTNFTNNTSYSYTLSLENTSLKITGTATGAELSAGKSIELVRPVNLSDGSYNLSLVVKSGAEQVAAETYTVVISGTPIPVTGISLNRSSITLLPGNTFKLTAAVLPANATNKKVVWSSSNTAVATVSNEGLVTAVGAGSASIEAVTEDGGKKSVCNVKVNLNVSGTLKYGDSPAAYTWLSLYTQNGGFVNYTYTDMNGKFTFNSISAGNYSLKAYSGDNTYKELNYNLTIDEGETEKELSVGFESKYSKRADITVKVNNASNNSPYTGNYSVYVSGYETNVYKWQDSVNGAVNVQGLPYADNGSKYYVSLYTGEDADYYYDNKLVNVSGSAIIVDFNVPVSYKISGTVKANDGSAVANEYVSAKDSVGRTYWAYTNENGVYSIRGLSNGTYTLSIDSGKYSSEPVEITISGASVTTGADIMASKGLTVVGKVLKLDGSAAYKAYVQLSGANDQWVAAGYSSGTGGYVFEGAIKRPGTYNLKILYVYQKNGMVQNFESTPVDLTVTAEDIAKGRISIDLTYTDPVKASLIFTGSGNVVVSDATLVRAGSTASLVIKYKNNGNKSVSGVVFSAQLPQGVETQNAFSPISLAAGEAGKQSITLKISSVADGVNSLKIPVKVTIDGQQYDFGYVSFEVANITLSGPEAVKTAKTFKVYGEATAGSSIVIKNFVTGEVLGSAVPNGRWYSAEIRALPEGNYKLAAVATKDDISVVSAVLTVDVKADQISVDKVTIFSDDSTDLPLNKLIDVRAFTAWVGPNLDGRDIYIGTKFLNGDSIKEVTYNFSDMEFIAQKNSQGIWHANLSGWSGAGLKTLTAIVKTEDGRTLKFIIAEATILIDPSGYITDSETEERLAGVTVICEVLNEDTQQWEKWDAELYGQLNPQISDEDGNYGWMVPAGTYRVRALKAGYAPYVTTDDSNFIDESNNSTIVIPPVRTDVNFALVPTTTVAAITLSTTSAAITVGDTLELTAAITPEGATNAAKLTWTSSNTAVATVSNGIVTALMEGTAIITAKIGKISQTCEITVNKKTTPDQPVTPSSGGIVSGVSYAVNSGTETAPVVKVDSTGKATISSSSLKKAETLTVKGEATIVFNKAALSAITALDGDVFISVTKANVVLTDSAKALIGDRPVYEFALTVGGKTLSNFGGGSAQVEIPYSLKNGEDANAIVVYYIDSNGILQVIENGAYDSIIKAVVFKASHFSKYAIGYNKINFKDVSGWSAEAVTYLSARGLINGVGNDKYNPNGNMTRGDFVSILAKIAGADLSKYTKSSFTDVKSSDRYFAAVEWAAANGIAGGKGNGKFSPKAYVTRQEMALMISKLAQIMNYELPDIQQTQTFADQNSINSFAKAAVKDVQEAGIINGRKINGKYYFAPKAYATRAETAAMLTALIKGMKK